MQFCIDEMNNWIIAYFKDRRNAGYFNIPVE
jgi:hypothetical protein